MPLRFIHPRESRQMAGRSVLASPRGSEGCQYSGLLGVVYGRGTPRRRAPPTLRQRVMLLPEHRG
ncbi:hypothetical protein E2C01_040401 [Portunus trituberculatus]|uniref:Uncharacterized protein n=1 Tax=Portunus trituberculatus TaxID=210409 RepID=A0A5B7FMF4_PORTR|nr:hypothetical protein [Portunus trituberculatus]